MHVSHIDGGCARDGTRVLEQHAAQDYVDTRCSSSLLYINCVKHDSHAFGPTQYNQSIRLSQGETKPVPF